MASYLILTPDQSEPSGYKIVGLAHGATSPSAALSHVALTEDCEAVTTPWEPVILAVTTETTVTVTEVESDDG